MKTGNFREAIEMCSQMLTMLDGGGRHLGRFLELLGTRSLARFRDGQFARAAEDARAMLEREKTHAGARVTLADALLNQHQHPDALAVAKDGLRSKPDDQRLQSIQAQAEARIAAAAAPSTTVPCAAKNSADLAATFGDTLWSSVRFKNCVVSVCPCGHGDFYSLPEAVHQTVHRAPVTGCTIILAAGPGIVHLLPASITFLGQRKLQIIGANPRLRAHVRLAQTANQQTASIFNAQGNGVVIWLQGLALHNKSASRADTAIQHCVSGHRGAHVKLEACTLLARSACVSLQHPGTEGHLHNCKVQRGSGAACLATDKATLRCDGCEFSGTLSPAVESRSGAEARVGHTTFRNTSEQAAVLWLGGKALDLTDCVFAKCGGYPGKPAVSIDSGKAVLLRCKIMDCPDDGVVVQTTNPDTEWPAIDMINCYISRCAKNGLAVFQGNGGRIEGNLIMGNTMFGMAVTTPHRGVMKVSKNHFIQNGPNNSKHTDMVVTAGATLDAASKLKGFEFDCNEFSGFAMLKGGTRVPIDGRSGRSISIPDAASSTSVHTFFEHYMQEAAAGAARAQTIRDVPDQATMSIKHFNKDALVYMQEWALRADSKRPNGLIHYTHPSPDPVGPTRSKAMMSSLKPCTIMELRSHLGKRASGRVLVGDVITHPRKLNSILTVMCDGSEHAVWVQIYNIKGSHLQIMSACPKGQRIGIREPHLKWRADAMIGIRVDDPADIALCCPQQCGRDCQVACPCCAVMFCSDACRQKTHGHTDSRGTLCGLQRQELNNLDVLVGKYDDERGRYVATFLDTCRPTEKVRKLFRPENVRLAAGTAVIITGLSARPDLNGKLGTVSEACSSDELRCGVELAAPLEHSKKPLALKLGCVLAAPSVEDITPLVSAEVPGDSAPTTTLKVVSWNVLAHVHTRYNWRSHGGNSCESRETPEQREGRHKLVAHELNRLNPDVVLLQEVDTSFMPASWQPGAGTALPCGVELLPGHTLCREASVKNLDTATVAILVRTSSVNLDRARPPVFVDHKGKTGCVVHLRHKTTAHSGGGSGGSSETHGSTPGIAVASVHLRSGEAGQKRQLLDKLVSSFAPGCARIVGGDLNTAAGELDQDGISTILSGAGLARVPAPEGCQTVHSTRQGAARAIDHVYVSKQLLLVTEDLQVRAHHGWRGMRARLCTTSCHNPCP